MDQIVLIVLALIATLAATLLVYVARKEAEQVRGTAHIEASEIREEARTLLTESQHREERVAQREKEFAEDQRNAAAYSRTLEARVAKIAGDEKALLAKHDTMRQEEVVQLAALADMDADEAKKALMARLLTTAQQESATALRKLEKQVKQDSAARARELLVEAMQSIVGVTTSENTVTVMQLPSEEMKGRIIGREGRNIRTFEALTGVNLVVEDGLQSVMLSSFDVERREIAEATLTSLVADGRIQPQRIEAAYAAALEQAPVRHREAALDAVDEAGLLSVPDEFLEPLGALRLRSSYGQTVLGHLVETARIAAAIAASVGADVAIARRAAFLHDLGKATSREQAGTHASIGAALALAAGEDPQVVNAIAAHHDEVPMESLEAVIVQIADAISASRPGARRDELDDYVERMDSLERLVRDYPGVANAVAMAAGREVRVVVAPDKIDDEGARTLARTIASHIENELTYPGEIKVTVIRELRADAIAG